MNKVLRENGRRLALNRGTEPSDYIEIFERGNSLTEGMLMITLTELIQFTSLLISVAGLFYLIGKDNHGKKITANLGIGDYLEIINQLSG